MCSNKELKILKSLDSYNIYLKHYMIISLTILKQSRRIYIQ